jgi:hypothetical protein
MGRAGLRVLHSTVVAGRSVPPIISMATQGIPSRSHFRDVVVLPEAVRDSGRFVLSTQAACSSCTRTVSHERAERMAYLTQVLSIYASNVGRRTEKRRSGARKIFGPRGIEPHQTLVLQV